MSPSRSRPDPGGAVRLRDLEPSASTMETDVLAGLSSTPKYLPSQYLYDDRGAALFEEICELPEYYLTRTEASIMRQHIDSIAACIGPKALLIEPGSGDGVKSRALLEGLSRPAGYVPIDISRAQLLDLAETVTERFPDLEVVPICADFTVTPDLPPLVRPIRRRVVFFPGSTIGNFAPTAAVEVLRRLRALCGEGGGILIGIDLRKGREVVEPAYDDSRGISRDFALNYLVRLNRELESNFEVESFRYEAPYDEAYGRIEMALVSERDQTVEVGGREIHFAREERIRTEYSYKYALEEFAELSTRASLKVERVWIDPDHLFSVQFLVAA